jgi:hypothetical protein
MLMVNNLSGFGGKRNGSAPIDPVTLFASGQEGFYIDVSDSSTLFQDTAGSTPVTATGQTVARINDKSGRGHHLVQSNSIKRPTYQQDAQGKYYLDFDGSNDFLQTTNGVLASSATSEASVVTAFRRYPWVGVNGQLYSSYPGATSYGNLHNVYMYDSGGTRYSDDYLHADGAQAYILQRPLWDAASDADPPKGILSFGYNGGGTDSKAGKFPIFRANKTDLSGGGTYSNLGVTTGNLHTIALTFYVGANYQGNSPMKMRLYGFFFRLGSVSLPDISGVEDWMNLYTGAY